ncbi:DUF3429 domain-containing protein [Thalassotalea maritima]|uniref:DUF3429 domain-containing protein n=1 Tax=Thalassotalea maritima TaxID=3242416 RepID=UPI003527D608
MKNSGKHISIALVLGWAGTVPFIGLAFALLVSHSILSDTTTILLFVSYSALIVSFLAGSLWAEALVGRGTVDAGRLLLFSNVIMLVSWCALLSIVFIAWHWGLLVLAGCYVALLVSERNLRNLAYPLETGDAAYRAYRQMRQRVSIVVVSCHIIVLLIRVNGISL